MIQAVANATVPRITINIGASFGAGNYAMSGRGLGPDFLFAWPNARISVMGGQQAARTLAIVAEAAAERRGEAPDHAKLESMSRRIVESYDEQGGARMRNRPPVGRRAHRPARYAPPAGLLPRHLPPRRAPRPSTQPVRRPPLLGSAMHLTHEHELLRKTYSSTSLSGRSIRTSMSGRKPVFSRRTWSSRSWATPELLGVNKPVEYGGLGLNFSYSAVVAETAWRIDCGGVPMAIGVQTDMATPALARFGTPSSARSIWCRRSQDAVACIGVSEPHAGSDVAAIRSRARRDGDDYDRWHQDVDYQRHPGRLDVHARQHRRWPGAS